MFINLKVPNNRYRIGFSESDLILEIIMICFTEMCFEISKATIPPKETPIRIISFFVSIWLNNLFEYFERFI